jgi:hypothetical protein
MFFPGSRVRVICSSVKSGKTGPRVNSEGFVANCENLCLVQSPNKWMPDLTGILFAPVTIIFYKYGNDVRVRCERKQFINILPLFNCDKSPEEIGNLLEKFEQKISMEDLYKIVPVKYLSPSNGRRPHHGIITPELSNVLKYKGKILRAWMSAVMQNTGLLTCYSQAMPKLMANASNKYKEILILDLLLAHSSKEKQLSLLKSLEMYPDKINAVQELLTVFNMRLDRNETNNSTVFGFNNLVNWALRGYMTKNKTLINERIEKENKLMLPSSSRRNLKILRAIVENITNRK